MERYQQLIIDLDLPTNSHLVQYFNTLFDNLIQGKIEPFNKNQIYTFQQHFKNLMDGSFPTCEVCWSFNHAS